MSKATRTLQQPSPALNRRSLFVHGASVAALTAVAAVPSARAAPPVFAPTKLGREMLALIYEFRAPHDDDRQHGDFLERYEALAEKILDQPINPSTLVDRALMARFDCELPEVLSVWLPSGTGEVDYHADAGQGLLAAVLALAGLPVDWDDPISAEHRRREKAHAEWWAQNNADAARESERKARRTDSEHREESIAEIREQLKFHQEHLDALNADLAALVTAAVVS